VNFISARLLSALHSLKLRITLSVMAVLLLGIGLSTMVLVRQAEEATLVSQHERELFEAARTAGVLSRRVVELQRALSAVGAQVKPEDWASDARLSAFIGDKQVLRGLFSTVFAADADGRMRALADATGVRIPSVNIADRDYFRRTLSEQRALVSEPVAGRVSSEPVIVFTMPLRNAQGVYGVVGGSLRLASRDLLSDMVDAPEVAAAMEALVVVSDAHGRILAHPSRARLMGSVASEPRLAEAYAQWVASGSSVEPAGLHLSQSAEVVTAAGVAGADWMVWRALPEAELLAPLRAARHQALAGAAGLALLMGLVLLPLVGWQLRPLSALEHRAHHLFDGSIDVHAGWPDVQGEIGSLAGVLRHVAAERAQLESFNAQVLQKLGSVMAAAPVGIAFTRKARFELVSAEFCRLCGRDESAMLGQPTRMIFASNEDYEALAPDVRMAFALGDPYVGEWQLLRPDGHRFWAGLRGRPVDPLHHEEGTIWTINDITEQVLAREQLEWSATHDALTGLANRKAFELRLGRVFEALPRSMPAALLMLDLDHFKPVNDTAGHAAGDAMLKAVASAITSRVRASDLVVRVGGDEFAVLLERCTPDTALRIAEAIRQAVMGIELHWEQRVLRVGASLGLAPLTADVPNIGAWVRTADAACYAAKAGGRGGVSTAPTRPPLTVVGSK
jgi:diguanylate cyclase (GGDEF)-like protein/PAS domain S-box-containing protein